MKFVIFALIGFMTLLFLLCALFFPEWVGIAGKKAREIEDIHHRDTGNKEKQ